MQLLKKIAKKILNDTNNEVAESILSNKEMIEVVSRAAPIGIGIVIDRVLIFVNDFLCDMLEYSREELIGKSSRIAYPTDEDYEYVGKEKYHQMEKSKTGTVETRFKTKSGKIINVILSSSYLDKDNPSKGAIFTALDITERENIEDELINTQKSLKTFIDGVPESILLMNKNGIVIEANDTVSKRLEIPRDKIIGSCIYNLVDRETSSRRKEYAKWVISSKLPLRIEDIRSDRIIENNLYPILDENNEVSHIAIIGYDITEKKKNEEILRRSEDKFRTFFENNTEYCYMVSPDKVILNANKAALKALGYEKEELIGKPLSTIYSPESFEKMNQLFQKWRETGYLENEEMTIISKSGEKYIVLLSSSAVKDQNGSLIHSISMQRDITEIKKIENQLKESEEKFRSIFEATADIITYTDCYGNILDTNSKVKDILGFEREEIIGKNFRDLKLIDIEEIPSLIKLFIKTISIGRALDKTEIALRNNKGDKVYFEIATQFIKKNKKVIGAVSIFRDITERTRMIEAVRESEEKFRSIFDSAQDAIFIINKEDRLIDANEKASKIFGYTKEEFLNMSVSDLQAPEVRGTPGTVIKSELEKYKWNTFEALDIDKFGNKISVEISQSLFNLKGEEVILNIVRDISLKKKMQDDIRDSEQHYRSLFENSPIAMWEEDYSLVKKEIDNLKESGIKDIREYLENDMDFVKKCVPLVKIIDFNASVLKLYNAKDKTEYLGNLSNVFSESSFNMFKEAMICIAEGKRELIGDDKNYTIDKKEIDVLVNWRVVPGHENNYDKVYVSDLDITPTKRAQDILKQSEEKYRRIVDTSNEGIWAVDENRITTFVNLKMTEMLGYSSEEMLGKSFESFVFKKDLPDAINRIKLRTQGISEVYERNYKKKDGSELPAIVSATPIIDENGNFKGSFVMVTDISERKRFEETIKQLNDNLKLLNKILRHDISNDLTVVSLSLEMLETKDEDIRNKAFNAIKRSVDLIEKIRVLESTMNTKYTLKQVNTKKVLDFIKKTYPHVKINISGECNLLADEAFMSVIDNIVNNAITHGKTDKIDIEITPDKNICQMKIIDHGKGIPDSIKSKIFNEEFSYGESRGTGLGLYISKKNIERYGGTIEVKDTKPHGATFIIKLKTCEL